MEFVKKLLSYISEHYMCDEVWWDTDLHFFIKIDDNAFNNTNDMEEITEEDFQILEKAVMDSVMDGALLYCARKRKMRPNKLYYRHIVKPNRHLFDECGPERESWE